MKSTDNDLPEGLCQARDRKNRGRVTLWALAWALAFLAASLGITWGRWPSGAVLAGAVGTALLGLMTALAYRRFLREADELRRKIEVEALSLAFGVGVFGGLSFWLLAVAGAVSVKDFVFVFVAMILTHPLGVFLGSRRYA